jgi:isoaspartyl peptidase/L-asparaginase-like protein (Ntn-hydrolase superfamily)
MTKRREFIKHTALATGALATGSLPSIAMHTPASKPLVLSTWRHGLAANEAAWAVIEKGGRALDAVEAGVKVSEADPEVTSVGYGGLPDRDGHVTLDACIMDEHGNAGSVAFLEHIMHPVSVARLVMEKTAHVMLVGEGALRFALDNGFRKQNLLTESSRKLWEEWMVNNKYIPIEWTKDDHDTIGMLAIDRQGNLSGACTTSGLGWKMHGRVGDSPIIGAGLFVDNETGAATATGRGEAVIKICGAHLIVELMRHGRSPQQACEEAVQRICSKQADHKEFQVGFLALNKAGETGAFAIAKGFDYALHNGINQMIDSGYYLQ